MIQSKGIILFTSESPFKKPGTEDSIMYWVSFLVGGSSDWPVYIEISEDEFFGVKEGKITARSVMHAHHGEETDYSEARRINVKYGLDAAISRHD